jgi:tRNA nucleotidyltransferase (CCA-adding enzyme)
MTYKKYYVGGCVRDEILDKTPNDFDFVIEGLSEKEYESIFPSHKKIGNHFPVYLNENGEEVALTRKETSNGNGYTDFNLNVIGVSIHEDLARRDFSMNSIAKHFVTGEIIDPFNGIHDIKNRIIRTINDDFVKDDPLRVFRLARFAAEFDFNIDKKTIAIIKRDKDHIKHVLPERIYLELEKAFKRSSQPSVFFRVLHHLDVLKFHFPFFEVASRIPAGPSEYHSTKSVLDHSLDSFDNAKRKGHSFDVAVASLFHDLGKILTKGDLLPHHFDHEFRADKLIDWIEKHHRFTAKQILLTRIATRNHMRFHVLLKIKNPVKLIRFFKVIKNNVDDIVKIADNDHELSPEQLVIIANLKKTFKETVIDIPKEILKKGKSVVTEFVERKYVDKFKEITKK